jgi:hypothetical protein
MGLWDADPKGSNQESKCGLLKREMPSRLVVGGLDLGSAFDRGCVETLNPARQTTNHLCSNFSASRKASVEAATPSSWRWKNQALAFSHSLDPKQPFGK